MTIECPLARRVRFLNCSELVAENWRQRPSIQHLSSTLKEERKTKGRTFGCSLHIVRTVISWNIIFQHSSSFQLCIEDIAFVHEEHNLLFLEQF